MTKVRTCTFLPVRAKFRSIDFGPCSAPPLLLRVVTPAVRSFVHTSVGPSRFFLLSFWWGVSAKAVSLHFFVCFARGAYT